ncbi:MAG TPA: ABC transporter permease [Candidatus Dormibacteraeota bacterium]|nr:ABC transporter permease [Candidatus Dormibacteraeota bacterium]
MTGSGAVRSRLRAADVLRVGGIGLRTRRLRTALSALGVAIGIASVVAVLGISSSSQADLAAQLDTLGTNLLSLGPGQTLFGQNAELPAAATGMVGRLDGVQQATATAAVSASVYRTDRVPAEESGGISVAAVRTDLLGVLRGSVARGRFLDAATERYPTAVLGAATAQRLGISDLSSTTQVWLGGHWFTVVGILDPLPLAPELDSSALIGWPVAQQLFGTSFDGNPTRLYVRAAPNQVGAVQSLLANAADPAHPEEVLVSRPSDALAARRAADNAFTTLFLGLGAVALLVGAVGIGNVMVIGVLERRGEVGLRRALGATRRHVGLQFLTESVLLSGIGGIAGALLGVGATAVYTTVRTVTFSVPPAAIASGIGAALVVGAIAGLYPAMRAARLTPTEALRGA